MLLLIASKFLFGPVTRLKRRSSQQRTSIALSRDLSVLWREKLGDFANGNSLSLISVE